MYRENEVISVGASPHRRSVPPAVFIIDDDLSVRESLGSLIHCAGWQPTLFSSAKEFLAQPPVLVPSCLVLDVRLPDRSGLELQQLLANRIELPIIFITGCPDVPTTVQAMKAGAVEFLIKPFADEQMLSAIRYALELSRAALSQESQRRQLQERYVLLSSREREVMSLVVDGWLNKQIAAELHITEFTVKAHRGRMMRKLGVTSVADLIRMAERLSPTRVTRRVESQPTEPLRSFVSASAY